MAFKFDHRIWPVAISLVALVATGAAVLPPVFAEARPSASEVPQGPHAAMLANLQDYLAEVERSDVRPAGSPAELRQVAQADPCADSLDPNCAASAAGEAASDAAPAAADSGGDLLSGDGGSDSSNDLLSGDSGGSDSGGGDSLLSGDSGGGDGDLLGGGGDSGDSLLSGGGGGGDSIGDILSVPGSGETAAGEQKEELPPVQVAANKAHEDILTESRYPSANTCATCHPKQYEEWSASQHAYAQLSPVFNAMSTTINIKSSATNGDFCVRCHTPIGMNIEESVYGSNLDRLPASREGITCVACHRVSKNYGKISGRFALEQGDLFSPVYGPTGDKELKRVLSEPQEYRVSTDKDKPGRFIHTEVEPLFAMVESGFCGTCHDVTLLNGFRLEEAFAEYKQTPAAKRGETCQDCHMGKVQGVVSGYDVGPAAMVGGVPTRDRKLTNHFFAGPDYSIVHPGIFPHNVQAAEFKSLREWLQFDYKAGWGTDKFENSAPKSYPFPEAWKSIDDRYEARKILNVQFERLEKARELREQVLRNGYHLSDINVSQASASGLSFSLDVINATDGHSVPTGFDAERLLFLQITVTDSRGNVVYQSGDRDPNGDVRDAHSLYVHNGELPLDRDLFSLQSKFVVRLLRGGEREQVLAVNQSMDVLPFVRPETRATTLFGRPAGARKHKETIDPLSKRAAKYSVPGRVLQRGETYTINAKLISQMVPVNLIAAIQVAGFDYGMSPAEVARRVVAGASTLWTRETRVSIR